MTKGIRTWNASDEVNEWLDQNAPRGKGFTKYMNDKIMQLSVMEASSNSSNESSQPIIKKAVKSRNLRVVIG